MRLVPYISGSHWDFCMIYTGSGGPNSEGRCAVLDAMKQAQTSGQFKLAKVDEKIEHIVGHPGGLGSLAEFDDHPSHTAMIGGRKVVFWGIVAGNYRLYAFEHGRQCVVAAAFATKKSQKTADRHRTEMEAAARKVLQAG